MDNESHGGLGFSSALIAVKVLAVSRKLITPEEVHFLLFICRRWASDGWQSCSQCPADATVIAYVENYLYVMVGYGAKMRTDIAVYALFTPR